MSRTQYVRLLRGDGGIVISRFFLVMKYRIELDLENNRGMIGGVVCDEDFFVLFVQVPYSFKLLEAFRGPWWQLLIVQL